MATALLVRKSWSQVLVTLLNTLFKKQLNLVQLLSLSDSNGYVIDENGIDFDLLTDVKEKNVVLVWLNTLLKKPTATYYEGSVWTYAGNYDIALPCATQNEIDGDAAKRLVAQGVKVVSGRQNMPR